MNGSAVNGLPLPDFGDKRIVNPAVDILEKILVEARAGRVTSVGIVMIDPGGGVATPWAGPQIAQLHLGAALMQSRIIRGIDTQPKPSIIPARMGG